MRRKLFISIFISVILFFVSQQNAFAATITWDGGGSTENWSEDANWSGDTEPGSGDDVVFNNTSDENSTVDATFTGTVNSLAINTGHDGTITMARSLTTTTTFAQSAGTFTASNQTLLVTTNFTLNSGATFTASSGTTTFNQAFTINGGSFSHNSGTVAFTGSGAATINCNNSITFNLVTFNNGATRNITNCTLPLGNNPTLSGSGTINVASTAAATLSGSGTLTKSSGTMSLNANATLSGFSGLVLNIFTVQGSTTDLSTYTTFSTSGTLTVSSGSLTLPNNADLNGGLTLSGGTLTAPSNMTIAGTLSVSGSPTFNNSSGAVTFDGGSSTTLTCGSIAFYQMNISTSGTRTLGSSCAATNFELQSGTFGNPASAYTLSLAGNFAQDANTTFGGANLTVSFTGSGTQSISRSTGTFSSLFNVNNSGTAQLTTAFTVTGQACTVTGGTFYLNGQTFTCSTGFTVSSGATLRVQGAETSTTPTLNSGSTVRYTGDGDSGVDTYTLANWSYSNLTINSTDGTSDTFNFNNNFTPATTTFTAGTIGTSSATTLTTSGLLTINGATWNPGALAITANAGITCSSGTLSAGSATIDVNGVLTLSGCAMTAPSNTMTVSGNFAHSSGTFTPNGGTVSLDGSSQQVTGSTTFYNFTKATSSTDTLTLEADATQTITNTTTLTGAASNLLTLASSSPGTQWKFDPQGTRSISYVSVSYSNNINSTVIAAYNNNNTDGGNNTNWLFIEPTPTPSPASSGSLSPAGAPSCTATAPSIAPSIYSALSQNTTTVTLTFGTTATNFDHYILQFGTSTGQYQWGSDNIGNAATKSYQVNYLQPNTKYYFRIASVNGCAVGPWSNEISVKTAGGVELPLVLATPRPTLKPQPSQAPVVTPIEEISPSPSPQADSDKPDEYELNILVTSTDGLPVGGASVTIHSEVQQTTTDDQGIAHFSSVEPGEHQIFIAYENYQGEQKINLTGDSPVVNLSIVMETKNPLTAPIVLAVIGAMALVILALIVVILRRRK